MHHISPTGSTGFLSSSQSSFIATIVLPRNHRLDNASSTSVQELFVVPERKEQTVFAHTTRVHVVCVHDKGEANYEGNTVALY